ncbi:serine/arginine repetitive matrix protein 2-like [Amphibalanus amphitrite]|uniref:serine/arginine repetitive matrix protein 2-like n=1 Tax=Amphibalanus amphitrite TaxID=1232801 RepID=UPI001C91B5CA|nr:serine/arginine repetitive matrix protein 2-like [Amphibalanus amphitrite]
MLPRLRMGFHPSPPVSTPLFGRHPCWRRLCARQEEGGGLRRLPAPGTHHRAEWPVSRLRREARGVNSRQTTTAGRYCDPEEDVTLNKPSVYCRAAPPSSSLRREVAARSRPVGPLAEARAPPPGSRSDRGAAPGHRAGDRTGRDVAAAMRVENSVELASLAAGAGRPSGRRKPAAGPAPTLCLHFAPPEINFSQGEVANAAAAPADAARNDGGEWWRGTVQRAPHLPAPARAVPCRRPWPQLAGAERPAEPGCRDRHAVTMPRPPAAPGAPAEGAAALLRRREAFSKGHSVSLDSADGLVTAAGADAAPPAGRAAAHESGSLSDTEESAPDSSVFSRLRLRVRQSPPPPPPAAHSKKAPERPQSPKAKARRVDRLREFTERLRHTDLKWGRDERATSMSPPERPPLPAAVAPTPVSADKPPSQPPRRHRRKARPPRPPPIGENAPVTGLAPAKTSLFKTNSAPPSPDSAPSRDQLSVQPAVSPSSALSAANVTTSAARAAANVPPNATVRASSVGPPSVSDRAASAALSAGRSDGAPAATPLSAGAKETSKEAPVRPSFGYYTQPRTIPFRSASFSRSSHSGINRTARPGSASALTIQPVYFSINKPAGTPHTTSQTLPKKFKAQNAPVPEEDASLAPIKPTHVRHKSDPVKDWEPPSTEQQSEPPVQASNPRDSLLLDALLKEINSDTCLLDRDDKQTAAAAADETPVSTKSGEDGTSSAPAAHAGSDSTQLPQPAEAIAQSSANETDTPAENTAGKSAKQTAECSTPPADGKQPLSNETKATDDAPQPVSPPAACDEPPAAAAAAVSGNAAPPNDLSQCKQAEPTENSGVDQEDNVARSGANASSDSGSANITAQPDVGGDALASSDGPAPPQKEEQEAVSNAATPATHDSETQAESSGTKSSADDDVPLRLRQAHEDVLNINLDQLDEDGAEAISQVQENFRQAVKMAVETLLSEVSAGDEQTELTSLPSGADHEREVAHVRVEGKEVVDEWTGAEDLTTTVTSVRKEQRQADQTLPPLLELEGKAAGISQHGDTTERRQVRPRRFKSKSLSPVPFRVAEEQLPQLVEEAAEPETLQRPAASRAKSRSLEHKQRSFDLLDRPPRERKRNQKRKEKVGFMLTTDQDSLSSSSSDEAHSRGRSQTLDPDFARPKAEKMRLKSHSARGRTTSDTATLRPLLTHQSHMGELLTLDEPLRFGKGRRHASPSFLSYDSDVDRFPRSPHGPRRRLRGPYGEMLEGKMSRGDTNRMARDDDSLKFLSALVESASPSPTPANSSPRVSRQERSSGPPRTPSDGELVQLEPSHVRTVSSPSELAHFSELLSEGYYDGVSPAAEGLISQLTAQEVGQLRAQPRKRGRRLFVIGELLDTERSYVESLRLLMSYSRKLREPEPGALIEPNTLLDIFHMIPEILEIHEDFLRELLLRADNWSSQQGIGEVFLDKLTQPCVLDTYTAFVNNWPTAREALRRACQLKPGLAKYLESLERSNKRKLSFTHLLIMPVQRIPRYELLLKQLVAHTPADHPDLEPLRSALAEVHLLATRINSLEQETMQNEALLQMLREVEAAVDGLDGLVTPDRVLVRHDQVTMTSALGTKKDRCLFLFNDLLVIASSKRRTGTARKPSTALDGSVTGLEANKYKLLMKIPLADLNIARSKDENLSSLLKEVEKIEEDITTLRQIGIMVCKLHCNHYQVEELVKEMANVLNKQLAERHRADSQLVMTQLNVTTPDGIENISMNFPEIEKRTAWEQTFNETKQKLALSAERRPVPEFLYPLPIRKTRAGLQFTCAAATPSLSSRQCSDVWVCNSDGYVGQICVLSLRPEPTVTSCNGVCNSRILCIAPVPGLTLRINGSPEPTRCASTPPTGSEPPAAAQSGDEKSGTIDLDSSSDSSDSDESRADDWRDDSSATGGGGGGAAGQADQPTMWLGTEDGCIYVYNCADYVRIKKTKVKVQLGSAAHAIVYLEGRVFVALANGTVSAYSRVEGSSWDMQSPEVIQVASTAVNRLAVVSGKLWACSQNRIRVINPTTSAIEQTVTVSSDSQATVQALVPSGLGVWLSFHNLGTVRLFHTITFEMICEVDVTSAVTRMLSGCDDIIRQHKTACLRVTSLMVCKDLLWIGTSAGVILNLPLPLLTTTTSWLTNTLSIAGISHGHTGHVRFLASVESTTEVMAPTRYRHARGSAKVKDKAQVKASVGKVLVISGGDGYEDFRSSGSELSGRDDSTNHLLLWRV